MPGWDVGGLALKQTFVGTLAAFDRSSRLRAVNDSDDVPRCGTLASSRKFTNGTRIFSGGHTLLLRSVTSGV